MSQTKKGFKHEKHALPTKKKNVFSGIRANAPTELRMVRNSHDSFERSVDMLAGVTGVLAVVCCRSLFSGLDVDGRLIV